MHLNGFGLVGVCHSYPKTTSYATSLETERLIKISLRREALCLNGFGLVGVCHSYPKTTSYATSVEAEGLSQSQPSV